MRQETAVYLKTVCDSLASIAGHIRNDTDEVVAADDPVEVIRHYNQLRIAVEQIKEAREALKEIEERLSREQVPDVMRKNGIKTTTIEGVGRVSLGTRWSASMPDKGAGMDWLRKNGHGGIIIETVNASTLGAFAKELNQQGLELPVPEFKTSVLTYTSITKA